MFFRAATIITRGAVKARSNAMLVEPTMGHEKMTQTFGIFSLMAAIISPRSCSDLRSSVCS